MGFLAPLFFPNTLGSHRLEGSVFVELGLDALLHVGEHGGDHEQAAPDAEPKGPSESSGKRSVVEV